MADTDCPNANAVEIRSQHALDMHSLRHKVADLDNEISHYKAEISGHDEAIRTFQGAINALNEEITQYKSKMALHVTDAEAEMKKYIGSQQNNIKHIADLEADLERTKLEIGRALQELSQIKAGKLYRIQKAFRR